MEKILAFHLEEKELYKLKQAAAVLKMKVIPVADTEYTQNLEDLTSGSKNPSADAFSGEVPPESLLVLCGFTDQRMDKLLLTLRRKQIQVDYKATLTPTNRKWNALRMFVEMRAEKAAYEKQ